MKFHLKSDATFEAENIDDALRKLSHHFDTHWRSNDPSIFEVGSTVEIEPSSIVASVREPLVLTEEQAALMIAEILQTLEVSTGVMVEDIHVHTDESPMTLAGRVHLRRVVIVMQRARGGAWVT